MKVTNENQVFSPVVIVIDDQEEVHDLIEALKYLEANRVHTGLVQEMRTKLETYCKDI